jgi:hypothetical protein
MNAAREWAGVIALTFYDVVVEPVWRGFKRGWDLGSERGRR